MYASLAMHSRALQDLPRRDGYIGHVHGWTKGGIDKWHKDVVAYSAWVYVLQTSLRLFHSFFLFYLFCSSILLIIASLLLLILFSIPFCHEFKKKKKYEYQDNKLYKIR